MIIKFEIPTLLNKIDHFILPLHLADNVFLEKNTHLFSQKDQIA